MGSPSVSSLDMTAKEGSQAVRPASWLAFQDGDFLQHLLLFEGQFRAELMEDPGRWMFCLSSGLGIYLLEAAAGGWLMRTSIGLFSTE